MVAQPSSSARAWSADPRAHELLRSPSAQQEAIALPLQRRGKAVRHQVEFTGTGKEYFGIWLKNMLLLLLTLGLYYPWAKANKLRFFHGHTRIAGHPLAFHGDPRKMLRGFALTVVLMSVYSWANSKPGTASVTATLIMALIWPALMRASLQFKLANSSWRGLRFKFTGTLAGAYKVILMPMAVLVGLLLLSFLTGVLLPNSLKPLAALPAALGGVAMVPYVWWHLKAYQHANYALGSLHTEFRGRYQDMFGIFFKASLLGMVSLVLAGGIMAAVKTLLLPPAEGKAAVAQWMALLLPGILLTVALVQLIQVPYFKARMQNLIWSQTGNSQVRFKSHLDVGALMRLSFKNIGLTLLTFGLYWPFAAVALARAQLEAIDVHGRQDLTDIIRQVRGATGSMADASGDAAADLTGLDMGL